MNELIAKVSALEKFSSQKELQINEFLDKIDARDTKINEL